MSEEQPPVIKQGEVVKLKSGGPKMTVSHFKGPNWLCVWFVDNALHTGEFSSHALTRAE